MSWEARVTSPPRSSSRLAGAGGGDLGGIPSLLDRDQACGQVTPPQSQGPRSRQDETSAEGRPTPGAGAQPGQDFGALGRCQTSQRFFQRLSDSYFGPAMLIFPLRCLFFRCDSYFVPAILILALRSLFCLSDSSDEPAMLIFPLRSLFCASDSYFVSAILPTAQRSLFWLCDPYFPSAILIFEPRRGGGGQTGVAAFSERSLVPCSRSTS